MFLSCYFIFVILYNHNHYGNVRAKELIFRFISTQCHGGLSDREQLP